MFSSAERSIGLENAWISAASTESHTTCSPNPISLCLSLWQLWARMGFWSLLPPPSSALRPPGEAALSPLGARTDALQNLLSPGWSFGVWWRFSFGTPWRGSKLRFTKILGKILVPLLIHFFPQGEAIFFFSFWVWLYSAAAEITVASTLGRKCWAKVMLWGSSGQWQLLGKFWTCSGTWRRASYNSCWSEPLLLLVPFFHGNIFSRTFLLLPNADRPLLLAA